MKKTLFTALMLGAAMSVSGWTGGVIPQKFILHGWDLLCASPEEILENADSFDRLGADGVAITLRGKENGSWRYTQDTIATDRPWTREMLAGRIPALRKFKEHPSLKESMLIFWIAPQRHLAWDDDAAWARFAGNVGVLAWAGHEAGLKGYVVDMEDYTDVRQYFHDPKRDTMSYEAACALARKRGCEVFTALFREHPDAVILSFWFMSEAERYYAHSRDPLAEAKRRNDLWPSFVNGIIDALPPTAKFVDGNEHGYHGESDTNDFYVKFFNQRQGLLALVAPENRTKYQSMLSVGFGQYLDCYIYRPDETKTWYKGPAEDGSRLTHFERNLEQAARVSSEYVWLYGEHRCWINWKKYPESNIWKTKRYVDMLESATPTWEASLPGLDDAVRSVKDPEAFAKRKLAELKAKGELRNLIPEGDCKGTAGSLPHGFSTWNGSGKGSVGIVESDGDGDSCSIELKGTPFANVAYNLDVAEGQLYAFGISAKGRVGRVEACWRIGEKWMWSSAVTMDLGPERENGWRRAYATVRIPKGADRIMLAGSAKLGEGETAYFDRFSAVRLR